MKEKRIDRILRELSELYEFHKEISRYKFNDDKNSLTVETADVEYKFSPNSDSE